MTQTLTLTPEEVSVIEHIALGHTTTQIAADLGTTRAGAKQRIVCLVRVTGSGNRGGLVGTAYRQGWLHSLPTEPRDAPIPLTGRRLDCITLASYGMTDRQIAAQLRVSENTVGTHLRRAFRALGARRREHAVALAYQHRYLPRTRGTR